MQKAFPTSSPNQKTVFITGAASGIGLATARRFANEGWFVGLYDINGEAIERLLSGSGFERACGSVCDVGNLDAVHRAVAHFAEATGGRMDVLINNAGVLTAGHFEVIDPGAHEAMVRVNVLGLTQVAQAAFPLLRDTADSTLLNLCSVSSVHGVPLLAVYSASKFYVNGLTQALSIEWAEHGIRVLSIKPPFVGTTMVAGMPAQLMKSFTVDLTPEQVADAIMHALAGSRDSYLLGGKARALGFLAKVLPASLGRRIVRLVTGY
ncbi:MAG: SDR family oxidoreductase [Xanthomonadales bacterium]|jgi:NAD(P)-dependent dehydrogenase (short-subunit alcohol dehydrogenase family)|nr:SDR family oxidoreductase [Xanthomonadales bacterium]